ncbi:NAD-dependent epimerase/dehydratase family protein [Pelomonas sp. KK5]|uniref:NAD-dependent epimerase/dehydratase family protein n=1 Tax=Pelomonas sp. KK5 TaxID=1855730 RepID=UPI00097C97DD|nr:NAD-dependent epimerase/dehydratase family protein [Pelomonas sp. KK5]
MSGNSKAIVAEDIARILEQPLPWEQLNGATVLVSGAGGFLPAYMVETLAALNAQRKAGIRIVGLVRNPEKARQRLGHLQDVELLAQDIAAPLRPDLPKADFIVHAASQASPRFYGADPVGTLDANATGTRQLLQHAKDSDCKSFLFFSSGEVYGVPVDDSRRLTETDYGYLDPATVRACYAESKRLGETLCVAWHHQHGVPARIVRPFHTYGPGMALDDGRVFADFVGDILARRNIVLKSDGLAMRPFCYLGDATAGFFTALLNGVPGLAYNVGNPEAEISMRGLAELLVGLYPELGLQVEFSTREPADAAGYLRSKVGRSVPNTARIEALGWRATTPLAEGFARTVTAMGGLG